MRTRRGQDGFTLIELLVVVLIIGILIAIAVPVFAGVKAKAGQRACFASERAVESAFASYEASAGPNAQSIADWHELMVDLVPSYLASAPPTCPAKGTYVWTYRLATCSSHGSYHD